MTAKTFSLDDGYKLKTITQDNVELYDALHIIHTDLFNRYYKATIHENRMLTFERHSFICPYCQNESDIDYEQYAQPLDYNALNNGILHGGDDKVIYECSSEIFNNVKCEICKKPVKKFSENKTVTFSYENNIIELSYEIKNIAKELENNGIKKNIANILNQKQIYKAITFDFNEHSIKSVLKNSLDEVFFEYDSYDSFVEIIDKYNVIQNEIFKALKEIWNKNTFPFTCDDINFNLMCSLVNFVGYESKDFYLSIPYALNSLTIPKSFSYVKSKLSSKENAIKMFEDSLLPNFKSLKRILFSKPQLLFYIKEIEMIWQVLNDVNFIVSFLSGFSTIKILCYMHLYPKLIDFFKDYTSTCSKRSFLKLAEEDTNRLLNYGVKYISFLDETKEEEKKKWISGHKFISRIFSRDNLISFNIPRRTIDKSYEMSINGYDFTVVNTTKEYIKAGNELNNCLVDYKTGDNPVIVIKKDGRSLAAMEINNDTVIQAYAKDNKPVSDYPEIWRAGMEYFYTCHFKQQLYNPFI